MPMENYELMGYVVKFDNYGHNSEPLNKDGRRIEINGTPLMTISIENRINREDQYLDRNTINFAISNKYFNKIIGNYSIDVKIIEIVRGSIDGHECHKYHMVFTGDGFCDRYIYYLNDEHICSIYAFYYENDKNGIALINKIKSSINIEKLDESQY
jgi:hypothetical protein